MQILYKLILAHIIGDFILQSNKMVVEKEQKKVASLYLYAHFLIHGLLVYLFTQSWILTLAIVVSHGLIDLLKLYAQSHGTKRKWFFYDQLLHLLAVVVIAFWGTGMLWPGVQEWFFEHILVITAVVFLTRPASFIIQKAISRWTPASPADSPDSLAKAGMYIGILERLFVFLFVMSGQWGAIGFLIAAKSVFRFGDLKESRDRKLTEYILIGTLMSIGLALLVGVIVMGLS